MSDQYVEIEAPDGTVIEFPASMTDEQISAVMEKEYPAPQAAARPKNNTERLFQVGQKIDSMKEAGAAGIGNALTFGMMDEGAGLVSGIGAAMVPGGKGYQDAYTETRDQVRDYMDEQRADEGGAFLAGEIFAGLGSGAALAKTAVGRMAGRNAIKSGAAAGAVYGAGEADGGVGERIKGGGIGLGAGAAGGAIGKGASYVAPRIASAATRGRVNLGEQQATRRAADAIRADADEFGVRLTKGQQTQDFDQQAFEQAARMGAKGTGPRDAIRPFFEEQGESLAGAVRNMGGDRYAQVDDAGQAIQEGVSSAYNRAKQATDDAYRAAEGFGAQMSPQAAQALPRAVFDALPDEARYLIDAPSDVDRGLYPATLGAIESVKRISKEIDALTKPDQRVTALDFRRIEAARKQINAAIDGAKGGADKRAAVMAKKGFDDFLDRSVEQGLFSGDEAFLNAYKRARSLRADQARKFEDNNLAKGIIEQANPRQVVNYLLGSSKSVGSARTSKLVPQIKNALGTDSEAWSAIREAAVMKRLSDAGKTPGPQALDTALGEMLNGKDAAIFRELFTADELAKFRRMQALAKRMTPIPGTVNYSNSANMIMRELGQGTSLSNTSVGRLLLGYAQRFLGAGTNQIRVNSAISGRVANPATSTPAGVTLPASVGAVSATQDSAPQ
jgi:hypothetical protein